MGSIVKGLKLASVVAVAVTIIYAIVGAGVVIWGEPGALSFEDYGDQLKQFVVALGILGGTTAVGEGVKEHGALLAAAQRPAPRARAPRKKHPAREGRGSVR